MSHSLTNALRLAIAAAALVDLEARLAREGDVLELRADPAQPPVTTIPLETMLEDPAGSVRAAVQELGRQTLEASAPAAGVIDLMEALKESLRK
jgi:hypothetical protein